MTPAIKAAQKAKIDFKIHEYKHEASDDGFGLEAVRKMNTAPERVFKTLVAELDHGKLAVAIIPVSHKLSLKKFAKACDSKKAKMADPVNVTRTTGYVLGGVSPIGQKKRLNTRLDQSAQDFESIFVSAGKRGLEIELSHTDLLKLTAGNLAELTE